MTENKKKEPCSVTMIYIRKNLVSPAKYPLKCPNLMQAEFITVHNTAGDASADAEIRYMISNNSSTSFHYAVDDIEIVQGLPEDRNGWHAGDGTYGTGNRKSIGVEICYSKSGGARFIKAEQNAAEFIAGLLKTKGWGIDRVKKHQDFSVTYCPHRTLDMGWQRFILMISNHLNNWPDDERNKDINIEKNKECLQELYLIAMGRKADEEGLSYWLNELDNKSFTEIFHSFVHSREGYSNYIEHLYHKLFHRKADAGGRKYWLEQLEQGHSFEWVYEQLITSPEYRCQ